MLSIGEHYEIHKIYHKKLAAFRPFLKASSSQKIELDLNKKPSSNIFTLVGLNESGKNFFTRGNLSFSKWYF